MLYNFSKCAKILIKKVKTVPGRNPTGQGDCSGYINIYKHDGFYNYELFFKKMLGRGRQKTGPVASLICNSNLKYCKNWHNYVIQC